MISSYEMAINDGDIDLVVCEFYSDITSGQMYP
jgi:hypothetical protein